jgi:hypothetical protein
MVFSELCCFSLDPSQISGNSYHMFFLCPFIAFHFIDFVSFFFYQISSSFGPAFLSKLYIAGALVGSTFYLVEKAFAGPGKQVTYRVMFILDRTVQ